MATKKKFLGNNGLDANNLTISNVATPSASSDASTKGYADTLVPSQAGNTGKYLTTNGSATSWATVTASASAEALTGTTIASTVTGSSLTSVGTITTGTWNASAIGVAYGGTGLTTLTAGRIPYGNGTSAFGSSANLFWDSTNSRLGIGTSSPAQKLDINGKLRFTPNTADTNYSADIYANYDSAHPFQLDVKNNGSTAEYLGVYADGGGSNNRVVFPTGNVGIGITSPSYKLDVNGTTRAERYRGINSLVLNTYTTVNPSSNVFLYSQANDRDAWLFLDSADTGSNWGIYHRQIDSTVSNLPANSIGFVGGGSNTLQAYISLANGQGYFAGNLGVGNVNPSYKLDVSGTINASGAITQNGSQVLTAGNYSSYAIPVSGGINMSGSYGLNDQKLFLRTNGDANHYLWNANDDWEELVAYAGTGFRVASSTGTSLMTFTTSAVNSGVALQQGGNQVLHAGNYTSYLNYGNPSSRGVYEISNWNQTTYPNAHFLSGEGNIANSPTTDFHYGIQTSFHRSGNAYRTQLVTALYSDTNIYVRNARDGDVWTSWKLLLHSSNFSSYALPLSGGTITGSIYATSNNSGGEFYSYGWFRNYNSGTGLYNQATGNHFYSDGGFWNVAYGGTQGIRFRNGHAGAILGYLYAETGGNIGLLSNQGNWAVRVLPSDAGVYLYGTEVSVIQTLYVHEGANRTRVPRTFVQSSTPTGTITNGDVWLQHA